MLRLKVYSSLYLSKSALILQNLINDVIYLFWCASVRFLSTLKHAVTVYIILIPRPLVKTLIEPIRKFNQTIDAAEET